MTILWNSLILHWYDLVLLVLVREMIIVDHRSILSIRLVSCTNFLEGWIVCSLIGSWHHCQSALARSILLLLDESCCSNGWLNLFALHLEEVGGAPQQVRVVKCQKLWGRRWCGVDAARQISLFKDGRGYLSREAAGLPRINELSLTRLEGLCHFRYISGFSFKFLQIFAFFEAYERRACSIHFIAWCVILWSLNPLLVRNHQRAGQPLFLVPQTWLTRSLLSAWSKWAIC